MRDTELLESAVSEYRGSIDLAKSEKHGKLEMDRLVSRLSNEHGWTHQGAQSIVRLANEYGSFMLRNALALSILLGKEDGDMGF